MEFQYEIIENISVFGKCKDMTAELNLISFQGKKPKYDIRRWREKDGKRKMQKGIALSAGELRSLRDALNAMGEI